MENIINTIISIAGTTGIAIAVSFFIIKYFAEKIINSKFDKAIEDFKFKREKEMKEFESSILLKQEYIKEVIKNQHSYFPGIGKAVYKTRNIIREILHNTLQKPELRSELGDLSLFIVEKLYEAKVFLPENLFKTIHSYKGHLQNFISLYDNYILLTEQDKRSKYFEELSLEFKTIDELSEEISQEISIHLKVNLT